MADVPLYTASDLPKHPDLMPRWKKRNPTRATRIEGPFRVKTIDGEVVSCSDGWLALDDHGHPYPIAASMFEHAYEPDPEADF